MDIKTMTADERKYTYRQSQQISMQTSFIGYLRADFGSSGKEFYSSWNDFRKDLKTDEFKAEFDDVINSLRENNGILSGRGAMSKHCHDTPESSFENDRNEYGVRVDTEKYAYLMRLNPRQGEYNLYCYCYEKQWLDRHISQAEKGIRFIDPHYKELFRIPDGDKIRITLDNGEPLDRECRYIDEYHLEVGNNLYHICEFAERMEQAGNTVIPLRSSLPEQCYIYVQTENEIGIVKKGESGYFKTDIGGGKPSERKALADEYNSKSGVTKAQAEAMKAGSMFGWHTPAADPKNYDENGILTKPKNRNKDYERGGAMMNIQDIAKSKEKKAVFEMVLEEACRQWCDCIDEAPERKDGEGFSDFFYEIFEDKEKEYVQQIRELNGGRLPIFSKTDKDHER